MNIDAVLPALQDKIDSAHADIRGHLNVLSEKLEFHGQVLQNTVTFIQLQIFINQMAQFDVSNSGETDRDSMMDDLTSASSENRPRQPPATIKYAIFRSHRSITSIWNEWHGSNKFSPECNVSCFPGGVQALEVSTKGKWRTGWNAADQKLFSRLKYLVTHIKSLIE